MMNQAFNLLGSIVILAMLATAVSKRSDTGNVFLDFFKGFAASIRAARG